MNNGYKLLGVMSKSSMFKKEYIKLIADEAINSGSNYFTVLIGNNGTGKSILLSSIARSINKQMESEFHYSDDINPSKIIAISNTISDKFPIDKTFRYVNKESNNMKYNQMNYVYLGLRSRNNFYSARAQFNKALNILVENYNNNKNSKSFRHIFDYLNYEPVIKINYSLSLPKNAHLSKDNIIEFLESKNRRNDFIETEYKKIIKQYNICIEDIIDFMEDYSDNRPNNHIIFNFSERNLERISDNSRLYNDEAKKYILLEVMKKLKIARKIEVNLFKKDGLEINFQDASSGEVAILSTLIALIPLIQNNCLILIDEPELSLHPHWQAQYIPLLEKILNGVKGSHIIIATHSPLMLSDLPTGKSSVVTFERAGSEIKTNVISSSTYGWSTEDILLNIFSVPTTRNYYLSQMITTALTLMKNNEHQTEEFKNIQEKLKKISSSIKSIDPFKDIVESIIEVI